MINSEYPCSVQLKIDPPLPHPNKMYARSLVTWHLDEMKIPNSQERLMKLRSELDAFESKILVDEKS